MKEREKLQIIAVAIRLGNRSDVKWIRDEVDILMELAKGVDYKICDKCEGRGLLKVELIEEKKA